VAECRHVVSISVTGRLLTNDCLEHLTGLPRLEGIALGKNFDAHAFAILARLKNLKDLEVAWQATPELSDLTKFPRLRMINFPNVGVQEPIWTHDQSKWMVCTPETVGNFSAVGYFFGRQLLQTLDVPVGLVDGGVLEWLASADASVVHEKVDSPEMLDGRRDQVIATFRGGNIALIRDCLAST
jgi:hypothetical protein